MDYVALVAQGWPVISKLLVIVWTSFIFLKFLISSEKVCKAVRHFKKMILELDSGF